MVKKRKLASSPPPPSENDWIGLPLPLSSKSIQTVRALHTYTYVHTYSDIVQCLITLCKDISVPFLYHTADVFCVMRWHIRPPEIFGVKLYKTKIYSMLIVKCQSQGFEIL